MSVWWVVGIAAVLLLEAALAWYCWRHHRATTQLVVCVGWNRVRPGTNCCRKRRCHCRKADAEARARYRAACPEAFSEHATRNGR